MHVSGHNHKPVAFADVRRKDCPLLLQAIDEDTAELLGSETVREPGAVGVPGFAPRRVKIVMTTGEGITTTTYSDGHTE